MDFSLFFLSFYCLYYHHMMYTHATRSAFSYDHHQQHIHSAWTPSQTKTCHAKRNHDEEWSSKETLATVMVMALILIVVKLVWLWLSRTNYTIPESMANISCKASWCVKLCKEHHLLHPKDDDKPNSKEGTGTGRTPMLMLIVLSIHPNAFDIFGLIVLYFVLSTWCNNFHSPCQSHQASWELHQNECKMSNNSLLYLIVEAIQTNNASAVVVW